MSNLHNTNHRVTAVFADPTDRRPLFVAVDPDEQDQLAVLETILWCELDQAAPLIINAVRGMGGRAVLAKCIASAWPQYAAFTDTDLDEVLAK